MKHIFTLRKQLKESLKHMRNRLRELDVNSLEFAQVANRVCELNAELEYINNYLQEERGVL